MKNGFFIFVLVFCFSDLALANNCFENAKTQSEMSLCVCNDFQKADQMLNKIYKKILKKYKKNKAAIKRIQNAQRAWLNFRDQHLESLYPQNDLSGSGINMCRCSALTNLTQERIAHLKIILDGFREGDLCSAQPDFIAFQLLKRKFKLPVRLANVLS